MEKFIFGKRKGIYIIDLEKTLEKLREAQDFLRRVVKDEGIVLFVGTKRQAKNLIKEAAESCGMPYVIERWVGGLLTNFSVIKERIEQYKLLLEKREAGEFDKLPKKEVVRLNKKLEKMEKNFSGVKNLDTLPKALFIIDPKREYLSVKEAIKLSIPIVALIDTDGDPDCIDYPIPGNDDALKSIRTILPFIIEAISEGLSQREGKGLAREEPIEEKKEEESREEEIREVQTEEEK